MGWQHHRAKVAALTRHRSPNDPAIAEATRDLAAERLAEHVRAIVDTFPPLTAEQRDRIATLLHRPSSPSSGGGDAVP